MQLFLLSVIIITDSELGRYSVFSRIFVHFETGYLWLGNSEIEYLMQTSVPYSEKWAPTGAIMANNVYNYRSVSPRNPDFVYVNPYRMYIYGVMWEHIEEAGRELGLLNGEAVNKDEPPVYDADTPTF